MEGGDGDSKGMAGRDADMTGTVQGEVVGRRPGRDGGTRDTGHGVTKGGEEAVGVVVGLEGI